MDVIAVDDESTLGGVEVSLIERRLVDNNRVGGIGLRKKDPAAAVQVVIDAAVGVAHRVC